MIANVVVGLFIRDGGWLRARDTRTRRCARTRMRRTSGQELPSPFPDTMHHWTPIKFATRHPAKLAAVREPGRNSRQEKQKGREGRPSDEGTENATRKFRPILASTPVEFPGTTGLE